MCRAHRVFIAIDVTAWSATLTLLFVDPEGGPALTVLRLLGTLAVVLFPYCMFPWLLSSMLDDKLKDLVGSFVVGYETAKCGEPKEPTRLHSVG